MFPRIAPAVFPDGLAGVVFDCDGVMIDSHEANRAFYDRVLAVLGLPPMGREEERYAFMATAAEALRRMVPPELHGEIGRAAAEVDYGRDILPLVRLMPGFVPFIELLQARGVRLAIDTNRTDAGIQRVLDFFSLPPYFDPVISASCARPKPSPAGAESILRTWGAEPGQALFVGDSENDREAARGAGMVFAGFGGLTGDVTVRDFAALADLLGLGRAWTSPAPDQPRRKGTTASESA